MAANNEPPKPNGLAGMGGVLSTLASSGDNFVKVLIVGGIILNTFWTKNNNSEIKTNNNEIRGNSAEIDKLRNQAISQIKVVFDNQRVLADFMDETRMGLDKIQTKMDIQHPAYYPYHRQEVPNNY